MSHWLQKYKQKDLKRNIQAEKNIKIIKNNKTTFIQSKQNNSCPTYSKTIEVIKNIVESVISIQFVNNTPAFWTKVHKLFLLKVHCAILWKHTQKTDVDSNDCLMTVKLMAVE